MKPFRYLTIAVLLLMSACEDDPARPGEREEREYAAVVNSVSATVSVFPVDEPDSVIHVALDPLSTATTIAVRDEIALVPLGLYAAVAVIDLEQGVVIDEIPLPEGSGATGVAIVDDSLACVANPMLTTVTPVLYRSGTTLAQIEVGTYPTALIALGDRVFVVEANLVNFTPAGPSTMSVIDAETLEVDADFGLSGRNGSDVATNGDRLFVVNAGDFGSANASVSVVDLPAAAESGDFTGFGDFASEVEVTLAQQLFVSSPSDGVAVFDLITEEFVIAPADAIGEPFGNVLGIGLDSSERLWVLDAVDCSSPGRVVRVAGPLLAADEATVQLCPDAIDFGIF